MLRLSPAFLLLLSFQAPPAQIGTGPEPSATPVSWEFKFEFLDPRRIEVQVPGRPGPEVFWYMVYTVTNPGPRTHRFFPTLQIVTEDLQVINTDTGIDPIVFNTIRELHHITHKYMVSPTQAIGELKAGDDNSIESVAIWRDFNLTANTYKVYIAGLSGETRLIRNPSFDPSKPPSEENPKFFTLRKTLEIDYTLPGSPLARPFVESERGAMRWIMR
jgi:hypothetical protein